MRQKIKVKRVVRSSKPVKPVRANQKSLKDQITRHATKPVKKNKEFEGDDTIMISTGSTLLDLNISGGRKRGGGIPGGGMMVVAYGPSGSGKTVFACEVAGAIQRQGGKIQYKDSEARLNPEFSKIFDLDYDEIEYERPDTISETFLPMAKWKDIDPNVVNGYIVDSLAALSTEMEMESDDGDKMGQRRAKDFSTHLRKGARIITEKNILLFCTNQIREKTDAQKFERKDINPGGKAIEFYASLILRLSNTQKIWDEVKVKGKIVKRAIGITTVVEVSKSSVWKPYRSAPVRILFDYGIDDITENLQYIKDYTGATTYMVNETNLGTAMEAAVGKVEKLGLEDVLREQVIDLWEEIETKFEKNRKKKVR